MADAEFYVTSPAAPRWSVRELVQRIALEIAAAAASRTPHDTGTMGASWKVYPGRDPGTAFVVNDTPYARYVEYGTRHQAAAAPLGRSAAEARRRA